MAHGVEDRERRGRHPESLVEPALRGGEVIGPGASGAQVHEYLVVGRVQLVGALQRLDRARKVVAGDAVPVLGKQPAEIVGPLVFMRPRA